MKLAIWFIFCAFGVALVLATWQVRESDLAFTFLKVFNSILAMVFSFAGWAVFKNRLKASVKSDLQEDNDGEG